MSAIGPGDFVECVDGSPLSNPKRPALVLGALYQVEGIKSVLNQSGRMVDAVLIVGLATAPDAYAIRRFRPIYRRDESLTTRLMQPLPADVEQVHA